jgi:hypothetical protein
MSAVTETIARLRGRFDALVPVRMRAPLAFAGAALVAGTLGWLVHSGRVTSLSGFDRAAVNADIERSTDFLRSVRAEREKRGELDKRLAAAVNRTLGERTDAVDTALRARLNRIAEETGVRDLMVATNAAVERKSPARQEMVRLGLTRAQRDEPDFVELRATLAGEGAADQVLRLVHRIAVDPMLKRVEALRLDPVKDGSRIRVTIRLSTVFVPGSEPAALPGAPSAEAIASFSKYASLAARNPFRVPAPTAGAAQVAAASPAPAAGGEATAAPAAAAPADVGVGPFPYGQWLLTGVVDGPAGTEAYFRNAATGEARVLRVNESIAEFAFVGLDADAARIAAGGATYRVRVGDSLEAREMEARAGGQTGTP